MQPPPTGKLFRIKTVITNPYDKPGCLETSEFVDWYPAETEAEALEMWAEDLHRYGLPLAKVTRTISAQ